MGRYRRIEITAVRRRIRIISGDPMADVVVVSVPNVDSDETIPTASDKGQETLIEAGSLEEKEVLAEVIRLLEENIAASSGH